MAMLVPGRPPWGGVGVATPPALRCRTVASSGIFVVVLARDRRANADAVATWTTFPALSREELK
jgi:hypothetical protein